MQKKCFVNTTNVKKITMYIIRIFIVHQLGLAI